MIQSGQVWRGMIVCKDSTGALSAPSVGPVGALYVNNVVNAAAVTIIGANPYVWSVTLPALARGDNVSMYITATISTIATASVVREDVCSVVDIDANGRIDLGTILGTALAETGAGQLATAFQTQYDVAAPVFTSACVNQTGNTFVRLGPPLGADVSADILTVINMLIGIRGVGWTTETLHAIYDAIIPGAPINLNSPTNVIHVS